MAAVRLFKERKMGFWTSVMICHKSTLGEGGGTARWRNGRTAGSTEVSSAFQSSESGEKRECRSCEPAGRSFTILYRPHWRGGVVEVVSAGMRRYSVICTAVFITFIWRTTVWPRDVKSEVSWGSVWNHTGPGATAHGDDWRMKVAKQHRMISLLRYHRNTLPSSQWCFKMGGGLGKGVTNAKLLLRKGGGEGDDISKSVQIQDP